MDTADDNEPGDTNSIPRKSTFKNGTESVSRKESVKLPTADTEEPLKKV